MAFADERSLPLDKAYPYLSAFLALPQVERNRIYLAYHAVRGRRPAPDARAVIVAPNGARTPVAFDARGQALRLPSLAELKGGSTFVMESAPFKLAIELRLAFAPSTHIPAPEIAAALAQVNGLIAKLAGALALLAPKLTTAYFPDSGGGTEVLSNGRTAPLPVLNVPDVGQVPYFEPSVGVRSVQLVRPPSRIVLGGHPNHA